jgi:hypothetical protein
MKRAAPRRPFAFPAIKTHQEATSAVCAADVLGQPMNPENSCSRISQAGSSARSRWFALGIEAYRALGISAANWRPCSGETTVPASLLMLLVAHRAILGTSLSRSVSGTCVIERCSPWSVSFPPQPPRKLALLCSTGSPLLRHSPTSPARAYPPFGLWPSRTGLHHARRRAGDLPVLVHVVSQRARVLRLRRTEQPLAR